MSVGWKPIGYGNRSVYVHPWRCRRFGHKPWHETSMWGGTVAGCRRRGCGWPYRLDEIRENP